eukprot:gb/GFBE01058845.1/.p1 GENE.gb/GFBE01058845.1/~~gb/GFBE01058845.1/.p1  ORF type:complete len:140 (+),score=37.02 gb/GFBE01058845.1/:1-420(+)
MFAKGLPIIYYGTELFTKDVHPSMWHTGWQTYSPGYKFIKALNGVRSEFNLQLETMEVMYADENRFVLKRGDVWIFLNNFGEDHKSGVDYQVELPKAEQGYAWVDVLSDDAPVTAAQLSTATTKPAVVVQRQLESWAIS